MSPVTKILFLTASPSDMAALQLEEEIRLISQRIRRSEYRKLFEMRSAPAIRATDLPFELMDHAPEIVHFSCHGSQVGELFFVQDGDRTARPIPPKTLARVFKQCRDRIKCVVLNACYSTAQAEAIAESIPCVVGMSRAVLDSTAIAFSAGFYEALAFRKSVAEAFELGLSQVELSTPDADHEAEIPKLIVRRGEDASKIWLVPEQPGGLTTRDRVEGGPTLAIEPPPRGRQRSNRPPAVVLPTRPLARSTASSHPKAPATNVAGVNAPASPLAVTPPVPRDLAVVHAELKKKLEAVLRESPALVKALHGYSTPMGTERDPVKAIANGLTLRHARDVVADLNELTNQDSTLRVAVVKLLGHVLPLAVDWDDLLAQAEAQKVQQDVLELPLRTMTLAEVINARLDGRSCLLVPGSYDMEGVAHVRLPSVAYAPMFDADGQGLAQAVLSNLWQEQQTSQTLLPDREEWQQIGRSTTTKDEFAAAAETEINKRGRKLNRYLLFMDAKLAADGIDEKTLDAWWNIAHHALQQTLPGLRLVRLKGRDAEWKKECGLISDIRGLHTP